MIEKICDWPERKENENIKKITVLINVDIPSFDNPK